MRRVAITGLGLVSSLGHDVESFWNATRNGETGVAPTTIPEGDSLTARMVAEVKDWDGAKALDRKLLGLSDRFSQFAVYAAKQAVDDAGDMSRDNAAIIIGTGVGGAVTLDESYVRLYRENQQRIHPFSIPRLMANGPASLVSLAMGITGPSFAVSSACSSSNHAIGLAAGMVQRGEVEAALAGGAEAAITYGGIRAWEALRVISPDVCRPFSADRKGMILGEGSGMVVLEDMERAKARGAHIYAELAGFGMSADAVDMVQPSMEGAARTIKAALNAAGMNPDEVDYINAHGTGTPANDPTETKAIRTVFGDAADKVLVSSTKAMHGHALGAAGALELIATLGAMHSGIVPPTINFTEADPACDLDYVPNQARERQVKSAVSNSFAFGGLNAVLALRAAP
jgi:nodulation protein E